MRKLSLPLLAQTVRGTRKSLKMTQAQLAARLCVSDKAVSKWETGRGFPDVSLLEPLGRALHISVPELLCGQAVRNMNRSSNMLKSRFHVCPVCGNVIFARGDALISCCGIQLPALEAEEPEYAGEIVKEVLCDMAARCCRSFERLPIVKNVEILRNILYSGIWVKFNERSV